jgi:hypothetical protein
MTSSRLFLLSFFVVTGAVAACTQGGPGIEHLTPVDPPPGWYGDPPSVQQPINTVVDSDSGAFGVPSRPKPAGADGGKGPTVDASVPDSGTTDPTACPGTLAVGDLSVVELMIASQPESGDSGEWIEIMSTRSCTLSLKGVVVRSTSASVTITDDLKLAPGATLVVADSADANANNGLPTPLYAWDATDCLNDNGDTVKVSLGSLTIDSLTYPAFQDLEYGSSVSFPSDCQASDRSDWQRWSYSFSSYSDLLFGTPNAPNDDVTCF